MLGFVREVRAAVLHLRDLRVRIERVLPVFVRRPLLPPPIESRQCLARRRPDARLRREPGQEFLVRLARVAADDAPHGGVGLQRCRVDRHGPALQQAGGLQSLLRPGEDRAMRLERDQPPGARNRGVIRRCRIEAEPHEAAHGQRVRGAPRDAALGIEPFEVPDQQQAEVPSWWQTRPTHHWRVELPTLLLREPVEAGVVEDGIQLGVERVPRRRRKVSGRNPHRSLLAPAFAHRHEPHSTFIPSLLARDF